MTHHTKKACQHSSTQKQAAIEAWLSAPTHHLLPITSDHYPHQLREIADPPPLLYIIGELVHLHAAGIAIVGSRKPTISGLEHAQYFAYQLSQYSFNICSGLALGIDAAAHKGALAAKGSTLAVLGCGIDYCYPRRHKALYQQIQEQGALLSEHPPGTTPRPAYFPQRNRIISGLSLGTLVVEAQQKSGSLITARLAAEQGREVFAIPGSINNPLASGCHRLISQGAKLVECVEDIVVELRPQLVDSPSHPVLTEENSSENKQSALDRRQRILLECLGHEPASMDQLAARCSWPIETISQILLTLELAGQVSVNQGQYQVLTNKLT